MKKNSQILFSVPTQVCLTLQNFFDNSTELTLLNILCRKPLSNFLANLINGILGLDLNIHGDKEGEEEEYL